MITDAQVDELYNLAVDILETDTTKGMLKNKMNLYDELKYSNREKLQMICSFITTYI